VEQYVIKSIVSQIPLQTFPREGVKESFAYVRASVERVTGIDLRLLENVGVTLIKIVNFKIFEFLKNVFKNRPPLVRFAVLNNPIHFVHRILKATLRLRSTPFHASYQKKSAQWQPFFNGDMYPIQWTL
jgi:hypothetical protein